MHNFFFFKKKVYKFKCHKNLILKYKKNNNSKMKLNKILILDIICLLISTTTAIPINENTNDVNSESINNDILETSLNLNNIDIDEEETTYDSSSTALIDEDDTIDEISYSQLSQQPLISNIPEYPITETFESIIPTINSY